MTLSEGERNKDLWCTKGTFLKIKVINRLHLFSYKE